jgi:hypothetical protein
MRAFFENQERKRKSRSEPDPSRWLTFTVLYAVTAFFTLVSTLLTAFDRHALTPWWLPAISTVCLIVVISRSFGRMRRDRRRLGLADQAS